VYVRKMPRASNWADRRLPDPQEHGFGEHCLGMASIFSSCRTNKLPLAHQR
jgi:hypothetical protein